MPKYPRYTSQPLTGNLPSMVQMGPSDLLPSSGTSPAYLRRLQTGRHLGALGTDEPSSCSTCTDDVPLLTDGSPPSDDSTYLRTLEKDDDAEGNGIFDSERRRPINYPDAGIFASNYGIPGYVARSRSFMPSEVIDATTGAPVVYVPGGAVSTDDSAKIAYMEGRAMAHERNAGTQQPRSLRTVSIDSVAMDTRRITSGSLAVVPETVPRIAATAAQAASNEVSRSLVAPSMPAPSSAPSVPVPMMVTPVTSGSTKAILALLVGALGFGVGYVISQKKPPTP